jgi:hypothetical protein
MQNIGLTVAAILLVLPSAPALAQTTCGDAYALCMSECGNSKHESAERCFQVCRGKQNFCLVNGKFSTGYQTFNGLQRVLDESPQFADRYGSSGELSAVKKQQPTKLRRP